MCGIVGILEKNSKEIDKNELKRFTNSLVHRGPDSSGIYINKEKNLGLGHRRLSIIDTRNLGDQPMTASNRYTVVFNGEIYNFEKIKTELTHLGHSFTSKSDTEVLLKSYMEWGEKCQLKFNGMWAFVIWDEIEKKLFMSRDRFGVKPLYYQNHNNTFFFSSELKSFMKLNKSRIPTFNDNNFVSLAQNFSNSSYNVGENTFLENVKELPPGYQLKISSNFVVSKNKWWQTINNLYEIAETETEIINNFEDLFLDACNLRMISDVKVATSLSGGMDSSSIVAGISKLKSEHKLYKSAYLPHETYILDYVNEKNNETKFALDVSNYTKVKPKIVSVKPSDFSESEIKKIIFHQEEVTGDDGLGPWQIYKTMKDDNVKVSIDGHGGDELLGGYSGYPKIAMNDVNPISNFLYWIDLLKIHIIMNDKNNDEKKVFKIFIDKSIEVLKNNLIKSKKRKDYTSLFNIPAVNRDLEVIDNIKKLSSLNKALYIDYHYKAMQLNLKKYDKFSMAHSIETRFPFLDFRLACFCFSLPNSLKIKNGFTKIILRKIMNNKLPNSVLNRVKKKGFNPENTYFNDEYKKFIHDTILSNDFQSENMWKGKEIIENLQKKNFNLKNIFKFIQIFYLKKTFKEFVND